jgi:hypothetical protein
MIIESYPILEKLQAQGHSLSAERPRSFRLVVPPLAGGGHPYPPFCLSGALFRNGLACQLGHHKEAGA